MSTSDPHAGEDEIDEGRQSETGRREAARRDVMEGGGPATYEDGEPMAGDEQRPGIQTSESVSIDSGTVPARNTGPEGSGEHPLEGGQTEAVDEAQQGS